MNILLLSDHYPPDKVGGVWETVRNLKEVLEKRNHRVFVLTTGKKLAGDEEKGIYRSGSNVFLSVILNNFLALRLIKSQQIDIVHLHQPLSVLFLGLKCLRSFFKFPKIISTFHGTFFSEFREVRVINICGQKFCPTRKEYLQKYLFAPVHIIIDAFCFLFADVVTTVSAELKLELEQTYGQIRKKSVHVVPSGVAINRIGKLSLSDKDELLQSLLLRAKRDSAGISFQDKKIVLYTGVFRVRKRVLNLIFALKSIVSRLPNVALVLCGGGRGYDEKVSALVKQLNLEQFVLQVGTVPNEDIPQWIALCDVYCLPSAKEGLPISLLEAMAAGKAVVTSDVSGMREIIRNGEHGILTKVDDIQELSAAILDLLHDESKREYLGQHAKTLIEAEFLWEQIVAQYEGLYCNNINKLNLD